MVKMEQTKQDNATFFLLFAYIFWISLVFTFAAYYFEGNFGAMFQGKTALYFVIAVVVAIFAPAIFLIDLKCIEKGKSND